MPGFIDSFKRQNFGPNDSMIASTAMHPLEASKRLNAWLQNQMNVGVGVPQYPTDEASIYATAPLDISRLQAAMNIAGLAETGSIPFAPKSAGGVLGTVAKISDDLPETEFSKAHKIAQSNAALPIEQGGLGLPPNNTAMDRAKAMGFGIDHKLYHGTTNSFPAFDTNNNLIWLSDDPSIASHYAENVRRHRALRNINADPNVLPVFIKSGKKVTVSDFKPGSNENGWFPDNLIDAIGLPEKTRRILTAAKEKGYDSVKITDMIDLGSDKTQNQYVVLSPNNLRSKFAAFDPMQHNSANILAAGLIGSLLLNSLEDKK